MSYSNSVSLCVLALSVGVRALYLSGASHTNRLSTSLRVLRAAELSTTISPGSWDATGADPQPDHIASATIKMGPNPWARILQDNSASGPVYEAVRECRA